MLRPADDEIAEQIKDSEHLTPDETGWRIGGHPAWLHGWIGDDGATLYAIDSKRCADVLEKVIGIDWSGA
ncbi:MAG: transposase [Planctomycetes bacterium]|nr:transposase [Planctomycetota bacterium]